MQILEYTGFCSGQGTTMSHGRPHAKRSNAALGKKRCAINLHFQVSWVCIAIICCCFSISTYADPANLDEEASTQTEYLTPDKVTDEDYRKMSDYAVKYDACLNEKSRIEINNYNDPRHVVDTAMKQCAHELENMNKWMTERKFPPPFIQRYIRKTSSRSVNNLLPAVMMEIAARRNN